MEWTCEAYGPALPGHCFFVDRRCQSERECADRMHGERQRVYRRIQELGAAGDETGAFLAEEFPSPDGLLNADRDDD